MRLARPLRRAAISLLVIAVSLACAHLGVVALTSMEAPTDLHLEAEEVQIDPFDHDLRTMGNAYARHRGKILEVALAGTPETIGSRETRMLRPEMLANEGQLWQELDHKVRSTLAKTLLFDIARVRFRHIDRSMSDVHRREIAAEALAFAPDPWDDRVPTYQRMVFLQALYDVSLSFEHSPLIGCTSFALTGRAAAEGHTLLARNFDFEAGSVFDEGKAVFLVREEGKIPYASVAWPGLIGAVTGMNAMGLAVVVHGGRARQPTPDGEPVLHTLRDILGSARNAEEAIAMLRARKPMVSHIILLADASGSSAVIERAPGEDAVVRDGAEHLALTNHFEGRFSTDPANERVRRSTSTLDRRARLDERLAELGDGATVEEAIDVLRDRAAPGGLELPLGDRRAIDALIATHGVVMDATARILWVSEGPHLLGRFIRFDLGKLLSPGYDPRKDPEAHHIVAIAADPLLLRVAPDRGGGPP